MAQKPSWPCPRCGSTLKIEDHTFNYETSADSLRDQANEAWGPDWITHIFSCLLRCQNDSCKEIVACAGSGGVEEDYGYDSNGEPAIQYTDYYRPKFFHPNLVMMDIPNETPQSVVDQLNSSFSLFFANPNAAANSARMAIEAILTSMRVRRFVKGTRKPISLHSRIESLPEKYQTVKDLLEAVKWIGNYGSHAGQDVDSDTLLGAYDILEIAIEDLYGAKRRAVTKLAKEFNRSKGPKKKKKRTRRRPA
ncbi:MAG: DUF4145 domain-containing protein [Phycisphaerales bacterium]